MKTPKPIDPEVELQGNELHGLRPLFVLLIYCVVAPIALGCWFLGWLRSLKIDLKAWLACRRDCSWCDHRMSGNPFSRKITHGVCESCHSTWCADLESRKLSSDRKSKSRLACNQTVSPVAAHPATAGNNLKNV